MSAHRCHAIGEVVFQLILGFYFYFSFFPINIRFKRPCPNNNFSKKKVSAYCFRLLRGRVIFRALLAAKARLNRVEYFVFLFVFLFFFFSPSSFFLRLQKARVFFCFLLWLFCFVLFFPPCAQCRVRVFPAGCPVRGPAALTAPASPRGLSQLGSGE